MALIESAHADITLRIDASEGQASAEDLSGNVYTVRNFTDSIHFDADGDANDLTSAGKSDILVQKSDSNGNFIWARAMGGAGYEQAYGIAVDSSGNVYTTGQFWDTADFDPGAGVANLRVRGNTDIFVSKLDAEGNFVWAKGMGGRNGFSSGYSIAVDGLGNVYTTGNFTSSVDFDPGSGKADLTSGGASDIFVQKLDSNGDFVWVKAMSGVGYGAGLALAVDDSGTVYITGEFSSVLDFDPGAGVASLTSSGNKDVFVSKLSSDGDFIWAKAMGGRGGLDSGKRIAVDEQGSVYTAGNFQGTADFDPGAGIENLNSAGSSEFFVSKLNSAGTFVWAKADPLVGTTGVSFTIDATESARTDGTFQLNTESVGGAIPPVIRVAPASTNSDRTEQLRRELQERIQRVTPQR